MKKKSKVFWILLLVFIIAIIAIKPYVWHPFEDNYSIQGVVKSLKIVGRSGDVVYMNFEATDGKIYNFKYDNDPSPLLQAESFDNLTRLSEGDKVELSIYSVGYYFISSEKARVAIYVKDVKWLR